MSLLSRGLVNYFDISYTICRFRTETPQSLPTSCSFCVCVKRTTLCNCLCSSSASSRFSASRIRNIGEFGAKKYFSDQRTANTIQSFVPIRRNFFGSILFQNKSHRRGIPQRLLDKYRHLCIICISLK